VATYKIVDAIKLAYEVDRAHGILLVHMVKGQAYTVEEVLTLLKDYGLDYSNPEYAAIGSVLIAEGVIEVVPD